eukprot:3848844-Prymnesium_polylepis.1
MSMLVRTCLPLQGVLHAAGIVVDRLLGRLGSPAFKDVLVGKAQAASYLHDLTSVVPVEAQVFFSSAAATFGSVGQANYASANASLDAQVLFRLGNGLTASSLQPSNVGSVGMAQAANDTGRHHSVWSLGLEAYLVYVRGLIDGDNGIHVPLPCDYEKAEDYSKSKAAPERTASGIVASGKRGDTAST